jgi:hypothetical protein
MIFTAPPASGDRELASPDEGEAAQESQQPERRSGHDDRIAYTEVTDDTAGHFGGQEQRPVGDVASDPKRDSVEQMGDAHGVHESGRVAEALEVRDLELGRRQLHPGCTDEDRREQEPEPRSPRRRLSNASLIDGVSSIGTVSASWTHRRQAQGERMSGTVGRSARAGTCGRSRRPLR